MPTDTDKFHYQFIHNVFGSFVENTLNYFSEYLYPRFEHTVVGTYDKAVEYITKTEEQGREQDKPNLPALILNPSGDFNIDDHQSLGQQLWRFPHLAPGLAQELFTPIYQDNNVKVTVAFTRLKGEFELISLLPSFYEYFDLKLYFLQMFGGEGRPIYPMNFNDFIIIPDELVNYEYHNDVTGQHHKLDWENCGAYEFLVKTTNQNELVYPGKCKPRYTLRAMSDGSQRGGGLDDVAHWNLTSTIEYEIEIPSFIIMKTDWVLENVNLNLRFGSVYSEYDNFNIPQDQLIQSIHWDSGLEEDTCSNFNIPTSCDKTEPNAVEKTETDIQFKTRYFHIVTEEQAESIEDIVISLPEQVLDPELILVNSKHGPMDYGVHYTLENSGLDLRFIIEDVKFDKGDFVEIYIFDAPFKDNIYIKIASSSSAVCTTGDGSPNRAKLVMEWALTSNAQILHNDEYPELIITRND